MAEWSIAAVLKTVELRGSGGSNPSLSADLMQSRRLRSSVLFLWCVAVGKPPHTPQKQIAVGDSSASTVERVLLTYAGVEPI